jgi:hypothetical protein
MGKRMQFEGGNFTTSQGRFLEHTQAALPCPPMFVPPDKSTRLQIPAKLIDAAIRGRPKLGHPLETRRNLAINPLRRSPDLAANGQA